LITRTILGEEYRSLRSSLCIFPHSPVTSQTILLIIKWRYQNNLPILKPICVSSSRCLSMVADGSLKATVQIKPNKNLWPSIAYLKYNVYFVRNEAAGNLAWRKVTA
jgi:hypothetical protein